MAHDGRLIGIQDSNAVTREVVNPTVNVVINWTEELKQRVRQYTFSGSAHRKRR